MVEFFFFNISKSCHQSHGALQWAVCYVDWYTVCLFLRTTLPRVIMLLWQLSLVLLTRIRNQPNSIRYSNSLWLDVSGFESVSERGFSIPIDTGPEGHPASCPRCKVHGVWRRQPNTSGAKVKNEWPFISAPPPMCLHGTVWGDLYLYIYRSSDFTLTDSLLSPFMLTYTYLTVWYSEHLVIWHYCPFSIFVFVVSGYRETYMEISFEWT